MDAVQWAGRKESSRGENCHQPIFLFHPSHSRPTYLTPFPSPDPPSLPPSLQSLTYFPILPPVSFWPTHIFLSLVCLNLLPLFPSKQHDANTFSPHPIAPAS